MRTILERIAPELRQLFKLLSLEPLHGSGSTDAEPESHQFAREILGPDFHGPDAAERHFGPLTDEERAARQELRLRDHLTGRFLSEDDTLRVVEACKGTHVLVATKRLSLVGLHAARKDGFLNAPHGLWFSRPEQQAWSDVVIEDPWLLVRKDVVPGSWGKDVDGQRAYLAAEHPAERLLLPAEYCFTALLHSLETGELLCHTHAVRFPAQTAEGGWVDVDWYGNRLYVNRWDGIARGSFGTASARTF